MDSTLLEIFSARLRETRGDMMQATFAQKIGVSRASLSSYENGTRIPDIETLKRIHEETGVSLYYLLGLTDSKDDNFANTQKETGLSERALKHISEHPYTAKVINHLIECGQMGAFSRSAATIHDDAILFEQYKDATLPPLANSLYNAISDVSKKSIERLIVNAMTTTFVSPEPFGINPEKLPSHFLAKYAQNPQDLKNLEEVINAQETPEQ